MRRGLMKSKTKKIILAVTAPVILLLIYGVFGNNNNSIKTEVVYEKKALTTINTRIFVVRDEKIISKGIPAATIPMVQDGAKVAKGDLFSIACDSAEDASAYLESEKIRGKIERYEQFSSKQSLSAIDIEKLDKEIDLVFTNMLDSANIQNFSDYTRFTDDLKDKLTNRQIAVGVQSVDLDAKITALKSKLAEFEMKELTTSKLYSEHAGYFVSKTDGNENAIPYNNISDVSPAEIEQAITDAENISASEKSGKVISSFNWYLLASVNNDQARDLRIGDKKELLIGKNGEIVLIATVYAVNRFPGEKTALVFVCNQMNETYSHLRAEDAKIVLSTYKGYKINNAAIRIRDNVKGVYVVRNNVVVFRKLNLLESQENYSIAEIPSNKLDGEGYKNIKLYDEIIVEGKNLYEGKVVRR